MSQTQPTIKTKSDQGHPLNGAFLRFKRALKHIEDAGTEIGHFESACANEIVSNYGGKIPTGIKYPETPPMLPVIVSDAIQNLRMALDYIVYELAIKDSGQPQDGTQFLIEGCKGFRKKGSHCPTCGLGKTPHGFEFRRHSYLKGISTPHIGMIESYQPYKGIEWTKTLRDISNRDKHRTLTLLSTAGRSVLVTPRESQTGGHGSPVPNVQGQSSDVSAQYLDVSAGNTFAIVMPGLSEIPLMTTLSYLVAYVCGTIERFEREFP